MRIHCADDRKFEVIKEIKERLQEEPSLEVCDLDGLRVKTDKGWWLVRASNTQDMLVCRCEAGQSPDLLTMVKTLERQLLLSGVSIENQPQ
jgi:phosphomannomutase